MTQEDMNRLATAAHNNGMKIGWKTSLHYADMSRYVTVSPVRLEQIPQRTGSGGHRLPGPLHGQKNILPNTGHSSSRKQPC